MVFLHGLRIIHIESRLGLANNNLRAKSGLLPILYAFFFFLTFLRGWKKSKE